MPHRSPDALSVLLLRRYRLIIYSSTYKIRLPSRFFTNSMWRWRSGRLLMPLLYVSHTQCHYVLALLPVSIPSTRRQQRDATDAARCSPLACIDPLRGFDPNSPSVGSCLFPGRSPSIPITTVGAPRGARAQQQRHQIPLEGGPRLGAIGGNCGSEQVQDGRDLLAPLWVAIVKVNQPGSALDSSLAPRALNHAR